LSTKKKTVCIEFLCGVDEYTVTQLTDSVNALMKKGYEQIIILISSPGGNVFYGLSAFNFLRGVPVEIITHNFGSVDSTAGIIFSAGSKRYSVPHARFLIHPLSWTYNNPTTLSEEQMEENLKSFRLDTENTAGVLAEVTGKSENGNDVANRALSRVNKRLQENYFGGKTLTQ